MMACWPHHLYCFCPVIATNLSCKYVLAAERMPLLRQRGDNLKDLPEEINQVIRYTQMALQQRGRHTTHCFLQMHQCINAFAV